MCKIGTCKYCVNAIITQKLIDTPTVINVEETATCCLDNPTTRNSVTHKLDHECHHVIKE